MAAVAELYHAGGRVAGFENDRWTTVRFAHAIYMRYGIRYDPDHVGRIMHKLGLRERKQKAAPVEAQNVAVMPEALEEPALPVVRSA
jgi:transposase